MKRNVSVFGLGYVGSVTAACLAHQGHHVVGVDSNAAKTESLESGRSPIIEKGLDDLIATARKDSRLRATTDAAAAVLESEISLICVGTPSQPNGKLDLTHIRNVCREIGQVLRQSDKFHWVVLRSTVLPGTTDKRRGSHSGGGRRKTRWRGFRGMLQPGVHSRRNSCGRFF